VPRVTLKKRLDIERLVVQRIPRLAVEIETHIRAVN
jgi:hypothetical protein